MKLKNIFFISLFLTLTAVVFTGCKDDDLKYEMTDDLFRPKMVQDPLVELNTILLVWYEIYDAKSYTIEVSLDNKFQEVFRTYDEYMETILLVDDIPYNTKFFIRLRSNSPIGEQHNSAWTETFEVQTPRRVVDRILSIDKDNNLGKEWVILEWTTDYETHPVDSIGIATSTGNIPAFGKTLTAEDLAAGRLMVEGLTPNTSYVANIYNTREPSVYDRPYNEVCFRTAGDPANPVYVPAGMDLTELVYNMNSDTSIPDGQVFILEAGATYTLSNQANSPVWDDGWDGVIATKGFTLMGESDPTKPRPQVNLGWWFSMAGDCSIMAFENIDFYGVDASTQERNTTNSNYLVNFDSDLSLELLSIYNCTFTGVGRGFIRTKNDNLKQIQTIEISDCRFYNMNGNGFNFIYFNSDNSDKNDEVSNIYFDNCTFANNNGVQWIFGADMRSLKELSVLNCTFYETSVGGTLVNVPYSNYDATFQYNLFAGETLSGGISLRDFHGNLVSVENYTTNEDKSSGTQVGATYLGTAEEPLDEDTLFEDRTNYNLRIIDQDSPVYINYVGDTYWF